jgi:TonB family protein
VLELTISIDGNVTAARMTRSIHPVYDARVTRAARQWKYRPALSDGVPIEAVKTVTIKVAAVK